MWRPCAALILALCSAASAGPRPASPAQLKLQNKGTQILGGQLEVLLPVEMNIETVERTAVTDAKPSWRDQVKASVELDGARFTMMAFETYASMGNNFAAEVAADLRLQGVDVARAKTTKLALSKPIVGFEVIPKLPKSSLDAHVLIYAAYVGRTGGTVQVLAFYISTDALPYALAWTKLARRIMSTVARGRNPIDLKAGERMLGRHFSITTPEAWVSSIELGTDSGPIAILQLREVAPLTSKSASCALQLRRQEGAPKDGPIQSVATTSTVLGVPVRWTDGEDATGFTTTTAIENAWRSIALEITCTVPTKDQLARVREMIGTLRDVSCADGPPIPIR